MHSWKTWKQQPFCNPASKVLPENEDSVVTIDSIVHGVLVNSGWKFIVYILEKFGRGQRDNWYYILWPIA